MTPARRKRLQHQLMPYVLTLVLLLLWEAINRLTHISSVILPPPSEIFSTLMREHAVIAEHALHTFVTSMIGFGLGVVTGVLIGFATGISPAIYSATPYPRSRCCRCSFCGQASERCPRS